jgi:hypothetical protein
MFVDSGVLKQPHNFGLISQDNAKKIKFSFCGIFNSCLSLWTSALEIMGRIVNSELANCSVEGRCDLI